MFPRYDLLARGYFPENLPPVFTSETFAAVAVQEARFSNYISNPTAGVPYNATKRGQQRRHFTLPHPTAAADTTLFLNNRQTEISSFLNESPYSMSTPQYQHDGRALRITPHNEIPLRKAKALANSRYVVKTDVSRFYPSIYTHALPWAFHGKPESKNDRRPGSTSIFFNRLDSILRNGQEGQTIGIPIGPDSSRLIAEILAVAIDKNFHQVTRGVPPLIRHVDDVWIGADSYEQAQKLLGTYRACLREYELDINELKTSILKTTEDLTDVWPRDIGSILNENFDQAVRDIEKLEALDRVFSHANKSGDDAVVRFALSKLDELGAWDLNWDLLESFLLRCGVHYPHAIDYIAKVLAWRVRRGQEVSLTNWRKFLSKFLMYNAHNGHDSEVCWGLWLAAELEQPLPQGLTHQISANCSAFAQVMLFICSEREVFKYKDVEEAVAERLGEHSFFDAQWLIAYEGRKRGWLDTGNLKMPKGFTELLAADVSFCEPEALPRVFEGVEEENWSNVITAIDRDGSDYEGDPEEEVPF